MSGAAGPLVVEVPPLLAGVRVDRAVAMLADVSRAAATVLIATGGYPDTPAIPGLALF